MESSCPSAETLGRLGVEIAEGPRFEELERHIERCAACQSSLERLAHGRTGWEESPARIGADRADLPEVPGFVIEEELGRGSMGVVYRAWQRRLARRVALKVISVGPLNAARERDRWLREAHSVARVRDPRVVQIHDVGEANGCYYLVLEFVAGGSLKDRLDGPLPAAAAAALAEEIADGVAAVHRAGLLHLDLKPSNILLESDPGTPWESSSPKVADFGIARDADACGMTRTSLRGPWGTPSYMAPEQVEPDRLAIGPASDVYALGAILYELLTGRPPFQAASLAETLDQIRHQDPALPRRLNPAIPQDLETICTTCLGKDPKRRYPTVDALSDDLGRWREGRPIAARRISIPERAWRWARRRPLPAALGAALAVTLILGILSLVVLWRRAESERRRAESLREIAQANYEVASQSLREICEFGYQGAFDPDNGWTFPPYFIDTLALTRARLVELLRKDGLQPSGREQLATVDVLLATTYSYNQKPEAVVRPLLDESIGLWETCIARGADPDKARTQQLYAMRRLAGLRGSVTGEAEIRRWNTTSTSIYRRLSGNRDATGLLFALSMDERRLANHLAALGQPDRARRFLQEKLGLFESLLEPRPDSPDLVLARTLTRTALGKGGGPSIASYLGCTPEAIPGGPRYTMLVQALAELTARTYGLYTLGPVSRDQEQANFNHTAWAEQVIRFLEEQTSQLGLDRNAVPVVAWRMRTLIVGTAADQRFVGNHEEARRIARLFGALAAEFVRTFPRHVEAHLLVCEAYLQDAKNASKAGDHAAVGTALRQSLEAAVNATIVAPSSEEAHRFAVDRRKRWARHESAGKQGPPGSFVQMEGK